MRKRIYIAGPYSAGSHIALGKNIKNGIEAAVDVFAGLRESPYCPWLDFQYLHYFDDKDFERVTVEDFYEVGLAWLEVADAMLVVGDYSSSRGTLAEIAFAEERGIPVFYDYFDLEAWLAESSAGDDNDR